MEAAQSSVKLADVLRYVLAAVERAPAAIRPPAFVGRDPVSDARRRELNLPGAQLGADSPRPLLELPATLDAALSVAAGRGLAALLASAVARTGRACNLAAKEAAGNAAARAARMAHAQAMHDVVRALRESKNYDHDLAQVAEGLAAWCLVADAATALGECNDRGPSPSRKWDLFAREFAYVAETPTRILLARRYCAMAMTVHLAAVLTGRSIVEPPEFEGMAELADADEREWHDHLVELTQGAPK